MLRSLFSMLRRENLNGNVSIVIRKGRRWRHFLLFAMNCINDVLKRLFVLDIVTALTNREGVSEKDIEDLEKMLAGKREGLTKKVLKKGKKD